MVRILYTDSSYFNYDMCSVLYMYLVALSVCMQSTLYQPPVEPTIDSSVK